MVINGPSSSLEGKQHWGVLLSHPTESDRVLLPVVFPT
jgi:hypothetical protein